jgi:D-sedoheptulose 7-phosphate isomerase
VSARVGHLDDLAGLAARAAAELAEPVERYRALIERTLTAGRTLFFAGNGGSAAHAQHVATEYVVRYGPVTRRAAPALALSTDTSLMTAAANDLGFERVFARQIEAHGRAGDTLVLISTSGRSPNLLAAAAAARSAGLQVAALLACGGGPLAKAVDLPVIVPTDDTALAQEIQLAIDHYVCSRIEPGLG